MASEIKIILMVRNVADVIARLHVKKGDRYFSEYFFLFFLSATCRAYLELMYCRRYFVSKSLNTTNLAVV